jgi:hypothetical protein
LCCAAHAEEEVGIAVSGHHWLSDFNFL